MKTRMYTDGACKGNPGAGGWGCIILLKEKQKEISGHQSATTNNRMEITAVIKGIKYCQKKNEGKKLKIDVYTDSNYVANAIKEGWLKKWTLNGWKTKAGNEVKNKDLWEELLELLKKHEINVIKVKGHDGNKYNEIADSLASNAAEYAKQIASQEGS